MDHQGQFRRAALESAIPDDEITAFTGHLRLSIRLSGGTGGVPAGQFGGLPRLPVGMDWPSAASGPLPFVFSVACASLPRVDGFELPADGSLLFFLDHERDHLAAATGEQSYAQVVYVPAGTDTEVAEAPANYAAGEQYDVGASLQAQLPPWFEPDEDEDDLSPFQQKLLGDLERDLPRRDELCALADALWPPDEGLASAFIGGYVDDEVITSIAEQTLAGREKAGEIVIPVAKWSSHVEKEKHRLTSEWVALADFSADDKFYSGSFVIRHDDLAARRLDKALSVTTFSE